MGAANSRRRSSSSLGNSQTVTEGTEPRDADVSDADAADSPTTTRVINALKELQQSLHSLTPAEQWEVKKAVSVASAEWQQGLAMSLKPVASTFGESVHGRSNFKVGESAMQQRIRLTPDSEKIILVMVGLPARGKSLYVYKLEQFLSWRGYKTKAFKVGAWRRGERDGTRNSNGTYESPSVKRRGLAGLGYSPTQTPLHANPSIIPEGSIFKTSPNGTRSQHSSASFFDSSKAYAMATREKVSLDAFAELLEWLDKERGQVAIFDACNVTIARRAKLSELVRKYGDKRGLSMSMVFIESICTDEQVVQKSMNLKVTLSNDFKGMAATEAAEDLQSRITHYEKTYQTVREAEGSYIKVFDLKAKVHACNIYGRMAKSVLPYMMAIHNIDRPVFLLPVKESTENGAFEGTVLTPADGEANPLLPGGALPPALLTWLRGFTRAHELNVFSSTQPRALAHAHAIAQSAGTSPPVHRAQLAPLHREAARSGLQAAGEAAEGDGTFKEAFGERVADLVVRLEPVALEIEGSTSPVLIVAHEGAVRALRTYLLNEPAHMDLTRRESLDASVVRGASILLEYAPLTDGHAQLTEKVHPL